MSQHFADRLQHATTEKGTPACVGLDPVYANLPGAIRDKYGEQDAVAAIRTFGHGVLDAIADQVAVVKPNIAFFEIYRGPGLEAYFELVARARQMGLMVIGDVKRGDIGHTSMAYARAQLADSDTGQGPDAVTLHGYLGRDGIAPFLDVCREQGKGIFVLVHTSNKSAAEVQHVSTTEGENVAERMARLVNDWAHEEGLIGKRGQSAVGAVVAPADVDQAKRLRSLMGESVFLVPGFGAQGRSLDQVAACFHADGSGAIVNSSRGVIFAYEKPEFAPDRASDWQASVERACADLVTSLKSVTNQGATTG